ncbi:hypothetical protein R3P38DRAFT_1190021 [Favolaschia claudopus]|uniref:Uncharacterized protein n=1 Tax=Favolaschia claudopus TaxID=2862362 RepID=A0AAW0E2F4_9AGAR
MVSSNRPPTPHSVHSWWSDSNSVGPTISIHAAAKPLLRVLYHRQVQNFIKRHKDISLSTDLMEICLSYLSYKYISPATKSLILKELAARVYAVGDADMIMESLEMSSPLVSELLASPDTQIRYYAWNILRRSNHLHGSKVWVPRLFARAVFCSSDSNPWIRESARRALIRCIQTTEGLDCCWAYLADASYSITYKCFILRELDIKITSQKDGDIVAKSLAPNWQLVMDLLRSEETDIRLHTRKILQGVIHSHMQTARYLRHPKPEIRNIAQSALTSIIEASYESIKYLIETIPNSDLRRLSQDIIRRTLCEGTETETDAIERFAVTLPRLNRSLKGAQTLSPLSLINYAPELLTGPWLCFYAGAILTNMQAIYPCMTVEHDFPPQLRRSSFLARVLK